MLRFRRFKEKVCRRLSHLKRGKFPAGDFLNSTSVKSCSSDSSDSDDKVVVKKIKNKRRYLRSQHKKIARKFNIDSLNFKGAGSFGQVFTGRTIKNGCTTDEKIAVKLIKAKSIDEPSLKKWKRTCKREMYYIHQLNDHENVVNIYDYYWLYNPKQQLYPAYLAIKFEHLEMSLEKCLKKEYNFTLYTIGNIGRQIGSAIEFMHEKKIVHFDIKPENIMVSKFDDHNNKELNNQTIYKLIDFGLSRHYKEKVGTKWLDNKTVGGTMAFTCEEKITSTGLFTLYNPYLVDSYAFGATLLNMIMGNSSFSYYSRMLLASGIFRQFRIELWARPDLSQFVTHPQYLKAIENLLKPQSERSFVFQALPLFKNDQICPVEEYFVQPKGGWPTPDDSMYWCTLR
ncbi:hypothetical protein BLOT_008543 [Blomia tropicalis]|nr:hypothetical protein BLOT_008543 [Blomia tropicalis]